MIGPRSGVRLLLARDAVDFRKGADGLAAVVEQACGGKPFSGDVFVFRPKSRRDRIRLLYWDGSGLVMAQKRLERGRFLWPQRGGATETISLAQWGLLIEGLDWRRVISRPVPAPSRAG